MYLTDCRSLQFELPTGFIFSIAGLLRQRLVGPLCDPHDNLLQNTRKMKSKIKYIIFKQ